MSQPTGSVYYPPPPPSPSTPSNTHGQRRPHPPPQPPAIATDVGQRYGSHLTAQQTPSSAVVGQLPFSPNQRGPVPSIASPVSVRTPSGNMNSYNPQEWGRGAPVSGQYVPHSVSHGRTRSTRDATGMEASLPSPPPPYSASASASPNLNNPRAFHISPRGAQFMQSMTASPVTNSPIAHDTPSTSGLARSVTAEPSAPASAAQPTPSMSFPPPPGAQRDRSGSRTRGVLNNIAAYASSRVRTVENQSPANPIEASSRQRSESITRAPAGISIGYNVPAQNNVPPNARRSASAGVTTPSHELSSNELWRDASTSNEQGISLPGPPPGPPPSNSRSQSMNRVLDRNLNESQDPSIIAPVPMRAARASNLGPVPPTPADWVDDDQVAAETAPPNQNRIPLQIDTQNVISHASEDPLSAAAASRREQSLSIRDRRSERAKSKEPVTAVEPGSRSLWGTGSEDARPANLVLSTSNNSGLGRRRHVAKAAASPRMFEISSGSATDAPSSSKSPGVIANDEAFPETNLVHRGGAAPTPPFSPMSQSRANFVQFSRGIQANSSTSSLPTPPNRDSAELGSGKRSASRVEASPGTSELSSAPLDSATSMGSRFPPLTNNYDTFARSSLERFEQFLSQEISASSDEEKLELFASFIVHESRLRRDRYSAAFEGMGSDVLDLTRDMWRSFGTSKRTKGQASALTSSQSQAAIPRPPSQSETATSAAASSASSPGSAGFTPGTEPDSPAGSLKSGRGQRAEGQRQASFQPMLSPIPSMAMSTVPDESDSRGRASSRWWEQSDTASFGPGGRKIERSKRESKYMGVPREARENLQWDVAEPSPSHNMNSAGPSNLYQNLGPNEYPPEKVGWNEEPTPSHYSGFTTPATPQPRGLDVSRLITLPPPYPRHHPAVNNNHPDLAPIRATLRAITDTEEPTSYFERYASQYPELKPSEDPQGISDKRRQMRQDIQQRVAAGEMSFTDAAQAETAFEDAAVKDYREVAQTNFDKFSKAVLKPLQAVLQERISKATAAIESLQQSLQRDASPDETQEEGDERPEVLEKITLMKWFFEARETLHKDVFELQNTSDEKYKHVILAPYRVAANEAKIAEVQSFFERDSRDRLHRFAAAAVPRFDAFLAAVDHTVARGVEAQLSAFWDIAPGLLAVVQKVPADASRLHAFAVLVPPQELAENPAFLDFPLQYLYTLLEHAEKSAYQFIESQTNLLCLLHEAKSARMRAACQALGLERGHQPDTAEASAAAAGPDRDDSSAARDAAATRSAEERRLTRELKDKVDVVEDQWRSALGAALGDCKRRIRDFLVQADGWDDALDE